MKQKGSPSCLFALMLRFLAALSLSALPLSALLSLSKVSLKQGWLS